LNKVWLAPAKINRFLHITNRRDDGYHELQTVFQFLDYADELSFEILHNNDIRLKNTLPDVKPEDDLIYRAAKLLQQTSDCHLGAAASVLKRIPMGGGLGGGSSDAATTLVALNQLWQINMAVDELAEIGVSLGADVPIFVHGYAAWAEGVGEKLTTIQLDEPWYLVINPDVHISTAEIFASPALKRNCAPITIERFLSGEGGNVCEPVVCEIYPQVQQAIQWLNAYAPARMTGTGASVFAPFDNEAKAREVLGLCPENYHAFVARGCNLSPLYSSQP
jgi:4-diphosphocytidyl-2-C-methyl-D-erythritol kinase